MGKGYRRKTRWRTLNIGATPGKEDEEEVIQTSREQRAKSTESNHKSHYTKNGTTTTNGVGTSYSTRTSPPRFQPKVAFNESEYTRITTPRQDMLFKKGYLAKKIVCSSNNPSTSATPSTTDSQSASHSTADGSETTEDQQLYDYRDNGLKDYRQMNEIPSEMGYGTFYDHVSGYYYEYPVMLGPVYSDSTMTNLMPSIPCNAVPLGPVEWVNPAYVSKLEQPYFVMDYQNPQMVHQVPVEDDQITLPMTACTNCTEDGSEIEDEKYNGDNPSDKEQGINEQQDNLNLEVVVDGDEVSASQSPVSVEACLESAHTQQLHVSHQAIPPQPHIYPHYIYSTALINVNGMTPMRSADMNSGAIMYSKRRNRKKLNRRKANRTMNQENGEDYEQEEEDCNSEVEIPKLNSKPFVSKSKPLNPNCKEFQLRPKSSSIPINEPSLENVFNDKTNGEDVKTNGEDFKTNGETVKMNGENTKINGEHAIMNGNDAQMNGEETKTSSAEDSPKSTLCSSSELSMSDVEYAIEALASERISEAEEAEVGIEAAYIEVNNDIVKTFEKKNEENCTNESYDKTICTNMPNNDTVKCEIILNGNSTESKLSINEIDKINDNSLINKKCTLPKSHIIPKKKYKINKNNIPNGITTGLNVDNDTDKNDIEKNDINIEVMIGVEAIELQVSESSVLTNDDYKEDNKNYNVANNNSDIDYRTNISDHPITDAVTQWLRRANSPELFVGLKIGGNNDDDDNDDDDDDVDNNYDNFEQSKNLQGNPMLALSLNNIKLLKSTYEFTINMSNIISKNKQDFYYNKNTHKKNCELIIKDRIVGMRVAENTRLF